MCNRLYAISSGGVSTGTGFRSFSGETRFALGNAGGKKHKQALLGLLRAGKGSIWLGGGRSFVV